MPSAQIIQFPYLRQLACDPGQLPIPRRWDDLVMDIETVEQRLKWLTLYAESIARLHDQGPVE